MISERPLECFNGPEINQGVCDLIRDSVKTITEEKPFPEAMSRILFFGPYEKVKFRQALQLHPLR